LRRTASFNALSVKIHAGVSAVGDAGTKKVVNMRSVIANMGCIFRVYGETKPINGLIPIFSWWDLGGIHDVITHARFGDDRLRVSWVVSVSKFSISQIPIDFAGRPYNTLTLQCERVIREVSLERGLK